MAEMDFISFGVDVIRAQIKGIDDSYRNPWDILAELAQNSIDAISATNRKGRIDIEVNSIERSVRFADNGCGISADRLPGLLNLFSSGKKDDFNSIGEKGVGLKFVLFQSSYFEITTSDGYTAARAVVKDASAWKTSSDDELIKMDFEELPIEEYPEPGTSIVAKGLISEQGDADEASASFFKMTLQELLFLLRSKTAIGNTTRIWADDVEDVDVSLRYIDSSNIEHIERVDHSYWLPIEGVDEKDLMDIEEFEEWAKKTDRSDKDKRAKLQGKILYLKGSYHHRGYRKISYWACMLPTRGMWDVLNKRMDLATSDELSNPEWVDDHQSVLIKDGICIATKGMPTGISIETPRTGNAGYWSNCFMLFQDDALQFDIGRKSIHGKIRNIYKDKAKELFNRIVKLMVKYTSARPAVLDSNEFDEYEIRRKVESIIPLDSDVLKFKKSPAEQEASVAAVFFELVGKGIIDDIEPIYLGYRHRYDMYADFVQADGTRKWGIYEFKSHLRNIVQDFSDAKKIFDEMDYIICWDVNDSDIQSMSDMGIDCEPFAQSSFTAATVPSCVTHRLSIPIVNPIYVIDLKRFIETLD